MHNEISTFYFLSLVSTYLSHPSVSRFSTFCKTSCSSDEAYASVSLNSLGRPPPRILIANRAALVELLIPTVATGIPRYTSARA